MDTGKLQDIAAKTGAQISSNRNLTTVLVSSEKARDTCRMITAEMPDFYHLSTITGVDEGNSIDICYHFWKGVEFLTVKTSVPKENPVIDTISDMLPAALLYEAEVKDLLGVTFKGNSMGDRKLVLPDTYPPQAPPPLRKEANPEEIRKMMGLE